MELHVQCSQQLFFHLLLSIHKVLSADLPWSTLCANAIKLERICVEHSFSQVCSSLHAHFIMSAKQHRVFAITLLWSFAGGRHQGCASAASCTCFRASLLGKMPACAYCLSMCQFRLHSNSQLQSYVVMPMTVVKMSTAEFLACSTRMLIICTVTSGLRTMPESNMWSTTDEKSRSLMLILSCIKSQHCFFELLCLSCGCIHSWAMR